jgi:hypothetical protein
MKIISSIFVVLVLLFTAMTTHAQTGVFAPFADVAVGYQSNQSNLNKFNVGDVSYNFGAGIESSSKHLLLDADGQFNGNNLNGNGYEGTINALGYLKLNGFLLGGGANWNQVELSNLKAGITLTGIHPSVGGGYQCSRDRFLINYDLPVGKNAYPNEVIINFHNEIFLDKKAHIRFTQNVLINSNKIAGVRQNTDTFKVGLKIVL